MNYYLLIYDRRKGEIIEHREYPEQRRNDAFGDRLKEMIARRGQADVEVVLFSADSFADLVKTHSRYFKTPEEIFAGIGTLKR